jgi:hypothetical protein
MIVTLGWSFPVTFIKNGKKSILKGKKKYIPSITVYMMGTLTENSTRHYFSMNLLKH